MKHRRAFGIAALVAGVVVLDSGQIVLMAQGVPTSGLQMYAAAMMGGSRHSQGYIGVEMRDVSEDQLSSLKLKDAHGVEITNLDQLRRMLREVPVGRSVSFVVSRDGQTQTLALMTADRRMVEQQAWEQHYSVPAPAPVRGNSFIDSSKLANSTAPKEHKDLLGTETIVLSSSFTGAKLEVMGQQLAEFFGATDGGGLLVRSVDEHSPAEEAGLRAGDVVVRINSVTVANGTNWTKTVHDFRGKPVPVIVLRDKQEKTLTLTPDAKKRSSLWPYFGLDGFFTQTSQQTRELLAKL
jgi:serine protease Do